ncbi:unnamed protein product [marine sediment metagenome]|uniref:Uncharacterized protein n=1 Tax=marine sediment metagenome TaxID=412755 RepID=X1PQW5_9ZZZZ
MLSLPLLLKLLLLFELYSELLGVDAVISPALAETFTSAFSEVSLFLYSIVQ